MSAEAARLSNSDGLAQNPIEWLRESLEAEEKNEPQALLQQVQSLFVRAWVPIINMLIQHFNATVTWSESTLPVGKKHLGSVLRVELRGDERSQEDRINSIRRAAMQSKPLSTVEAPAPAQRQYRYLLIYLKDVFGTFVYTELFRDKLLPNAPTSLRLAIRLLYLVDNFLRLQTEDEKKIERAWKQMNAQASELLQRIFPNQVRWRRMFKRLFPFIQPYLAFDCENKQCFSILTKWNNRAEALLNIPDAVSPESELELTGLEAVPLFRSVAELGRFYQQMRQQFVSPSQLPQNSQASASCRLPSGSSVPRNTRLQLSGSLTEAGYVKNCLSYQVASPALPANWWQAFARIFFNAQPKNAAQLRDFCQAYCETTKQMCDRAFSAYFDAPAGNWRFVYLHLVSKLFPPEIEVSHAMDSITIPDFIYANSPFKDFQRVGVTRIDYQLTPQIQSLLSDIAGEANQDLVSFLYEVFRQLNQKKLVKDSLLFLMIAAADASLDQPVRSMLAWYAVMLLEHYYSPCRREDKAPYWKMSFEQALGRLTSVQRREFALRWNVFVHMEPQIAVVSALFALMIDRSSCLYGVEGCKSAKDRATEFLLYKSFVQDVLFNQSLVEMQSNLKLHLVHNLVFLMLYAHVPGTMANGEYAQTAHLDQAHYGNAGCRLRSLNHYLRQVRDPVATYRASVFGR